MPVLTWDGTGEKVYETGVDHGVLYIPNSNGVYDDGVAWNGLVTVTESPSGAEANKTYADNIVYGNLISAEEFGATIEAYTYPDEFAEFDGTGLPVPGLSVGQQFRKSFGMSYRSLVGNDVDGTEFGYKLHLLYGLTAAPSEKAYGTVNDSPEMITFSWEVTSVPTNVTGMRPTSVITVDSTQVDAAALAELEDLLYGTVGSEPTLPTPDEVIALFSGTITEATATDPTFTPATGAIVIPTVTGVQYRRADTNAVVTGTVTIATPGDTLVITANGASGYVLADTSDDDWSFTRDP